MQQVEINLPESLTAAEVIALVDHRVAEAELTTTLRGTLTAYPDSTHWHLKQGRQRGVLEVTYWPATRRLWFSVHENRDAPWIWDVVPDLCRKIELSSAPT